jgi:hypothetical protein
MNDFFSHVYGSAIKIQSVLNRGDGPINTGAVATRGSQKNSL